jgi:DNA-binding CsgD family transcriptional regulator
MSSNSPEQIRGERLDARTDLYPLGCVAYERLAGVAPFVRQDPAALLWAHLEDRPTALSDHQPRLGGADRVVAKAFGKEARRQVPNLRAVHRGPGRGARHRTPVDLHHAAGAGSHPGRIKLDSRATTGMLIRLRAAVQPAARLAGLSEQERAVLELIGQGLTNPQLGQRLSMSEKTVKAYVSLVLAKLGVARRTQAAALAADLTAESRPSHE